uniref:Ig-like domain-containing protein n=1 Tax=Monopterus albus TaxID=43700 RepID=A0A3Q3JQQ7_MONAL
MTLSQTQTLFGNNHSSNLNFCRNYTFFLCVYAQSEPPVEFTKPLEDQTVEEEATATLECEVTGKPEPRVKWTKADLVLKPDDRVSIDTKPGHSTVTIAKTKRDDSSTYIIEATNSSGRATATGQLSSSEGTKVLCERGRGPREGVHLEGEGHQLSWCQ